MDTTIFFLSCLVSFCLQKFLDKNFPKGGKGPQEKKDYLHGLEMVKSCAN